MTENSNLFLSLGKEIKDEYGRTIGTVTSFAVNPYGTVDSIYIEQGDGRFLKHPTGSVKIDGSEITLLSKIRMGATTLRDQIPLIWRKNQALKELLDKDKISPEVYNDLHNSFEGVLDQLKNEAKTLIEDIGKEITICAQEIKELNYALVHLELEHEIGKVDEQSYLTAFATIQECLKKANVKKSDLETLQNNLSNILLGETTPQSEQEATEEPADELKTEEEAPASPSPSLPEPPVVVYVKEAGKSGI